ncbi:hypothetical protein BKA61DRAFT_341109 [Leptodontidium sp. MPI-SDFR-AT-0119]|nr:hypothetical protein BKA61DRAFT_341109 [Leptodontidium sp. MPI-SDFR-AT-0119]
MSDSDSLYGSPTPTPPPQDSATPAIQIPGLGKGEGKANCIGSHSLSDGEFKETSSLEPEITGVLPVRPSQTGVANGDVIDDGPASQPPQSARENLSVSFIIIRRASDSFDEEAIPGLSAKDKGKWKMREELPAGSPNDDKKKGWEVGDRPPSASKQGEWKVKAENEEVANDRPDVLNEEGYVIADPDPDVEVFAVATDEERAEIAMRAKFEEDAKHIYPIGPGVVAPPIASAPALATPAQPIPKAHIDEESDYDGEQPTTGIERAVQKRGNPKAFVIVRLIENTDKTGNSIESSIRLRKHYFDVDFGDFLLDLSGARTDNAQVRNYAGQERYIPRRMLQNVYQPWDIPAKTKITDDGVPIPLAFVRQDMAAEDVGGTVDFETEEPVMIMDKLDGSDDQQVTVTDWERKAGSLNLKQLDRNFDVPWGILIDEDALRAAWGKKAAPKLPKEKGIKRKRDDDYDGEDEDDQTDDSAGGGPIEKTAMEKAVGKKATKKQRKEKKQKFMDDEEPIEDEVTGPSESTIAEEAAGNDTAAKRPAKRQELDNTVGDEEHEPSKVAKGKGPVGETIAAKKTAGKKTGGKKTGGKKTGGKKPVGKKPAGKKPGKKTTGAKKSTMAKEEALLEAVAEEEESADQDAA